MSVFKRAAALLTAVSLAAVCSGCGMNTRTALTVDGYEVPAGVYIYYANTALNNALSQLAEEDPDLDTTDLKAVKAATLEGQDVLTWIQDKATEMCVDFVATEKKFDELGLTLDADAKNNISMMMDYYWSSDQATYEKNGISEASFEKIVTSSYKSDMIFMHFYGVDGEEGVTEDELYDYYAENNIRCQYVAVALKDGEGNLLKSDGKADMMDMVEEYRDRVEDAMDNGGVGAVMTEMDYIQEDYNYYVTSVSEAAAGVTGEAAATTTKRTTTAATTTVDEDETDEETEETTAAVDEETEETTAAADEETEETTAAADEEAEKTTAAPDEEAETTTGTETTTAASETETETETVPFLNEHIISIIDPENYEDEEDITYTPSEDVYNKLLEIGEKDYGKPFIVEEDETYYLVVRYDIKERMTEDDLWGESAVTNADYTKYNTAFQDDLDEWSAALTVQRNDAAYKSFDPFKFDFS